MNRMATNGRLGVTEKTLLVQEAVVDQNCSHIKFQSQFHPWIPDSAIPDAPGKLTREHCKPHGQAWKKTCPVLCFWRGQSCQDDRSRNTRSLLCLRNAPETCITKASVPRCSFYCFSELPWQTLFRRPCTVSTLYLGLEPCCVWFLGMLTAKVAKIQSVWSWSVIVQWSGDF